MTFVVKHARSDGTYVVDLSTGPYHVTKDDPMFQAVQIAALGMSFPPEPQPAPVEVRRAEPVGTRSGNSEASNITRRQAARMLFKRGDISGPEMVAMTATGTPPALVETILAALPTEDQWEARADFAADTYERHNPLLNLVMMQAGATPADVDAFFLEASKL